MSDYWTLPKGQTLRVRFNWPNGDEQTPGNADLTGYTVSAYQAGSGLSGLDATLVDAPTGEIEIHLPFASVDGLPTKKKTGVNDFIVQIVAPNGDGTALDPLWVIREPEPDHD